MGLGTIVVGANGEAYLKPSLQEMQHPELLQQMAAALQLEAARVAATLKKTTARSQTVPAIGTDGVPAI